MSRTFRHAPDWVQIERNMARAEANHGLYCIAGFIECDINTPKGEGACCWVLPRHLLRHPWDRGGTHSVEKRAGVRQALRGAVRDANADNELEDLLMPAPRRTCVCWLCGTNYS